MLRMSEYCCRKGSAVQHWGEMPVLVLLILTTFVAFGQKTAAKMQDNKI